MRVQKSIDINATPAEIWPFFFEPDKVLQWMGTYKKFEYASNQHAGVGTPYYIEEQAGGTLMKLHFEAIEWKENERLVLRMVSGTGVKAYQQLFMLASTSSGSRFTFMEEVVLPFGIIGKLIGLIIQRMSQAEVTKMQFQLKVLAEA